MVTAEKASRKRARPHQCNIHCNNAMQFMLRLICNCRVRCSVHMRLLKGWSRPQYSNESCPLNAGETLKISTSYRVLYQLAGGRPTLQLPLSFLWNIKLELEEKMPRKKLLLGVPRNTACFLRLRKLPYNNKNSSQKGFRHSILIYCPCQKFCNVFQVYELSKKCDSTPCITGACILCTHQSLWKTRILHSYLL